MLVFIGAKLIENFGALLLADLLLAGERQHFHDNLFVCVDVCKSNMRGNPRLFTFTFTRGRSVSLLHSMYHAK